MKCLRYGVHMAKLTIVSTTVLRVVFIIFLTAANGWAVASYSLTYRIGCTSCHTSGSKLNDLGVTFKKNGHSFGGKNVPQEEKRKQVVPKDDKGAFSKSSDGSQEKPESINSGVADDSKAESDLPDAVQPVPETRVYSWKGADGTPHFSDSPQMDMQGEKRAASDKASKKITRAGFRPLSAIIPKRTQRTIARKAAGKSILPSHASPVTPEPVHSKIMSEYLPKSYEKCMEQILSGYPIPKNSETAMKEFQEAENICAPLEKK